MLELVYADIATFGKAPPARYVGLEGADVAVFGIPWDATATLRPGARLGPRGVREQSIYYRQIIALDLVELAPSLDPTNISSILAAHALFGFIEERFLLEPEIGT